jgi:hypothetical protein
MDDKKEFNPYPEGIIKPIPKEKYRELNPEHRELLILFNEKNELEENLKEVKELIAKRESDLLKRIDKGEDIPWCWKWIFLKTNIAWKAILEKTIGKKEVQKISASTPQTEYPHIGIEGFHARPKEEIKSTRKLNLRKLNLKKRKE